MLLITLHSPISASYVDNVLINASTSVDALCWFSSTFGSINQSMIVISNRSFYFLSSDFSIGNVTFYIWCQNINVTNVSSVVFSFNKSSFLQEFSGGSGREGGGEIGRVNISSNLSTHVSNISSRISHSYDSPASPISSSLEEIPSFSNFSTSKEPVSFSYKKNASFFSAPSFVFLLLGCALISFILAFIFFRRAYVKHVTKVML